MSDDTIYALSSGTGAAGIAVIRISGPEAARAGAAIAGPVPAPRAAVLRTFRDPSGGQPIDSGLFLFFAGPASFTGEDLVELHAHGSLAVIRRMLGVLAAMPGLRQADAGEFTARAFRNGKMDLIEVEALGNLLAAETESQARMALTHQSRLRDAAADWRRTLIDLIALTEAYIDFSDEDDVQSAGEAPVLSEVAALAGAIGRAAATLETGERIRRGYRVAILGPPNAGKSSLLNALAQRDVAITSPIPGTTRDAVEVHLDLGGFAVILIDTAGIRETADTLEQAGIARAHAAAASADLVIWLSPVDSPVKSPYPDSLEIGSKADKLDSIPLWNSDSRFVSVMDGRGLGSLIDEMRSRVSAALTPGGDALIVANARQANELARAAASLGRAEAAADLEIRAEELRAAAHTLDRLVGRIGYEDILDAIFSRFCIGK